MHYHEYQQIDYEPRGTIQYQVVQSNERYYPDSSNVGVGFPIFVGLVSAVIIAGIVFFLVDRQFKQDVYQPKIKRSKNRMPRVIKFALYLALVKLVWMAVDAAPQIAQFISSKI